MPITCDLESIPGVICSVFTGQVTDQELHAYYRQPFVDGFPGRWLELVDGTGITSMGITSAGEHQLAAILAPHIEKLRGGRVAMVATSDVVFGMFRMWELQREGVGYEVSVFRDVAAAREWLLPG